MPTNPETLVNFATPEQQGAFRLRPWLLQVFAGREIISEQELAEACKQLPFKWVWLWRDWDYATYTFPMAPIIRLLRTGYIERLPNGYVRLKFPQRLPEIEPRVLFAVEFESNFIGKSGIVEHLPNHLKYHVISTWSYQSDPTAGTELRPLEPWDDINFAFNHCLSQFRAWTERCGGITLHFKGNKYYPSLGGHIHVSIPSWDLSKRMKVAKKLYNFLPFLYFINANGFYINRDGTYLRGTYSHRMCFRNYSPYLVNWTDMDSRSEISLSRHGSLELRMFDANVPAVALAVAYLVSEIVKRWARIKEADTPNRDLAFRCLFYPPDYRTLLEARKVFQAVRDIPLENVPLPIKEVLVLSFCFLLNPSKFVERYSYDFSLKANTEGLFLDAIEVKGWRAKVKARAKEIATRARTLGDLLDVIILTEEVYFLLRCQKLTEQDLVQYAREVCFLEVNTKTKVEEKLRELRQGNTPIVRGVPKEVIQYFLQITQPQWLRIRFLPRDALEELSRRTGYSVREIEQMNPRWYVRWDPVNHVLLGAVVITWSNKEVVQTYDWGVGVEEISRFIQACKGGRVQ
jgi:hypothetical protein